MRPALAVALALGATLTVAATPAHADGWYFTEQLGGAEITDELAPQVSDGSHFAVRLALGKRVGPWALEGFFKVVDAGGVEPGTSRTVGSYGVDFRRLFRMGPNSDFYLRGGLSKAFMNSHTLAGDDTRGGGYRGRAFEYGAGVQLHGRVRALGFLYPVFFFLKLGPKIKGAITIDWTRQFVRFHKSGAASLDAGFNSLMVGFMVGKDF